MECAWGEIGEVDEDVHIPAPRDSYLDQAAIIRLLQIQVHGLLMMWNLSVTRVPFC